MFESCLTQKKVLSKDQPSLGYFLVVLVFIFQLFEPCLTHNEYTLDVTTVDSRV